MVLRIPETGFQLESSEKTADNLPLQAFAITLSDNVIEDLIQCVQDGEDIRLSLGNVPVSEVWVNPVVADSVDVKGRRWNLYCSTCRTIGPPNCRLHDGINWNALEPLLLQFFQLLKSSSANFLRSLATVLLVRTGSS